METRTMNVGDVITLSGKTKHGKNRIREQGAAWKVIQLRTARRHGAFPEGTPMALLRALSDPSKHWRWIRQTGDLNFNITEVR
tara:strand:- start:8262 stop:8510 length:249 start_codon:yes stop_codon:yes gene_type:complete